MINNFNSLSKKNQKIELEKCCGSSKWIQGMINTAPFENTADMHKKSDIIWQKCKKQDYLEAFTHHPKIGDIESLKKKFANTSNWASKEQQGANQASDEILKQLKFGNEAYLKKFGFIFIICATGKTAEEMLNLLKDRLDNNKPEELNIAAAEQNKITHLRLDKLLSTNL